MRVLNMCAGALVAAVIGTGALASTLVFNEVSGDPDALGNSLAAATDVGPLSPGVNVITGGLSLRCLSFDVQARCTSVVGDGADAVQFSVPSGLVLTDVSVSLVGVVSLASDPSTLIQLPPAAPLGLLSSTTGLATVTDLKAVSSIVSADLLSGAALTGVQNFMVEVPVISFNAADQVFDLGWGLTLTTAKDVPQVPLPAPLVLMLSGLGVLGLMRTRA